MKPITDKADCAILHRNMLERIDDESSMLEMLLKAVKRAGRQAGPSISEENLTAVATAYYGWLGLRDRTNGALEELGRNCWHGAEKLGKFHNPETGPDLTQKRRVSNYEGVCQAYHSELVGEVTAMIEVMHEFKTAIQRTQGQTSQADMDAVEVANNNRHTAYASMIACIVKMANGCWE